MIGSWESECSIVFRFFDREGTKPDLTGPSINLILIVYYNTFFLTAPEYMTYPLAPERQQLPYAAWG